MRALYLTAAVLFGASAALQLNDPDPVGWFLLYACAAGLCLLHALGFAARPAALALAGVAVVWASSLVPGVLASAAFTGSEEERELAGLLLVALVSAALGRRRAPAPARGGVSAQPAVGWVRRTRSR